MDEIIKLKAEVYDLIDRKEILTIEISNINNEITEKVKKINSFKENK